MLLDCHRRLVGQVGRRGAGAGAVDEREGGVEADLVDQLQRGVKIGIGFAGKADDEVRRQGDVGPHAAQLADLCPVLQGGVAALHGRQHPVGTRLHRQVQMVDQFRHLNVGVDQVAAELERVGGGVADAVDALDLGHVVDQLGEVRLVVVDRPAVGVDVLAEQVDLAHALARELSDLAHDIGDRPAHLLAPGVGHHAECAVAAASLHHRDEGGGALRARLGQVVELLDLGEAHIDHGARHPRLGAPNGLLNQLRQPMQGLGAEHDVHEGCPPGDGGALLAGHATADADQQIRIARLQPLPAAELVKHLFLGLLANGAGVEQDQVGLFRRRHGPIAVALPQGIRHPRRVVLVHLAALGLYEQPRRIV